MTGGDVALVKQREDGNEVVRGSLSDISESKNTDHVKHLHTCYYYYYYYT